MPSTTTEQIDEYLSELTAASGRWATAPIREKIDFLQRSRELVLANAADWVAAAVRAKQLPDGSPLEGEEWTSGPYAVLSWIAAMEETLTALSKGVSPLDGFVVRQRPDGQTVVDVYPHNLQEKLLLNGYTAEVWMQPGITPSNLRDEMATFYRRPDHEGRVALVLGAGNIASIPPLDVLYKLYADGEVVLLKMNPVNEYLGPILAKALAPFVDAGFLRIVYGGGDVGAYLTSHPSVANVHITGSEHTHDVIVYGPGDDGLARKARDERLLDKPITSELGGVGATIIVPGPWKPSDYAFQAEHVATQKLHNSGFNCVASQVVVFPESWDGSTTLLTSIRETLRSAPPRPTYYPGAEDRRSQATAVYLDAERIDTASAARTLITDVDANDDKAYAFHEEFFAPIQATTKLPGANPAEFLRNAVRFANETLHGTLGVNIVIHPKTAKEYATELEQAIADLRFGTVAVNAWTAVGYLNPRATWGAFPGHTYDDVQSGIGVVHNAMLFAKPQKTVVRGPFRRFPQSLLGGPVTLSPRPPWFVTNKTAAKTGRLLTTLSADGKWRHIPAIFVSALRG